eukprot:TRINITY_DN3812_c0_g2_i2.p1 TRINITY_DN3812_c0_g2~~TRINITY_DN3812_c0_g2_i2.p1  ORF type:complete len:192 (+),score=40.21 TRINITY_DN3812_c0_g2_i2:208-783(+)
MKLFPLFLLAVFATGLEVVELHSVEEFNRALEPEYELSLIYLQREPENERVRDTIQDFYTRMEGFALLHTVPCSTISELPYCNAKEELAFLISKPPDYKVNPYTKEPMKTSHFNFTTEALLKTSPKDLTLNMLGMLSRHAQKLKGDEVKHFQVIRMLNKVLLFTEQESISYLFRALAAHYKNRMLVNLAGV